MEKKWFKAKKYGWGWYPATWQGWLVMAVFIFILVLNFRDIDSNSHSASDTLLNFIPDTIILVLALIIVCWLTGEKPGWRWGDDDKK